MKIIDQNNIENLKFFLFKLEGGQEVDKLIFSLNYSPII